jgi:hypothetical protein
MVTAATRADRHESPGTDHSQANGRTMVSDIHKLINPIWNKEEFPQHWKESISAAIYKGDKAKCCNYCGIITVINYKTSSNILLSRLTPYAHEIIGDHQC